jgi:hypothetical protein
MELDQPSCLFIATIHECLHNEEQYPMRSRQCDDDLRGRRHNPEFVQVVYTASAESHNPEKMCPDENNGDARFLSVSDAERLPMAAAWRAFLRLATGSESDRRGRPDAL